LGRPSIDPELMIRMLLYTGVRRSDVVRPGPQHARSGWLRLKVHKNRDRHPIEVEIPILPDLQRIPDARTTGNLAYLVSAYGKPYSEAGFGMRFRKWCDRGELPNCSAHGLRKAGAALAPENGATEYQLMALRLANQRNAAAAQGQRMNESFPLAQWVLFPTGLSD